MCIFSDFHDIGGYDYCIGESAYEGSSQFASDFRTNFKELDFLLWDSKFWFYTIDIYRVAF